MNPQQTTLKLMKQIYDTMMVLDDHLNALPYDEQFCEKYPFEESLEDIAARVGEWCYEYQKSMKEAE